MRRWGMDEGQPRRAHEAARPADTQGMAPPPPPAAPLRVALLALPGHAPWLASALLQGFQEWRAEHALPAWQLEWWGPEEGSRLPRCLALEGPAGQFQRCLPGQQPTASPGLDMVWVLASGVEAGGAVVGEWLREQAALGCGVAGVDAGAWVMAQAGLLDGHRATLRHDLLDAAREAFPDVIWSDRWWEEAPAARRWSAGPGVAAVELWLRWALGWPLMQPKAHARLMARMGMDSWREHPVRLEQAHSGAVSSPKLGEALALMAANLAEPLSTDDIAGLVGISRRQLERLFRQQLQTLPSRHYLALRLERAQRLLRHSTQSILQIGLSCGFSSGPHFSNAYKAHFGHTPREERARQLLAALPGGGRNAS